MNVRLLAVLLMLLMAVVGPSHVSAGGWALVTLDTEPTNLRPDQSFKIGFIVRQHGVQPIDGLRPIVSAVDVSGTRVEFEAESQGAVGHYVATMTLPAGTWTWQIDAFNPIAHMGTLVVQSSPSTNMAHQGSTAPVWIVWTTGIALIALGGISSIQRRRVLA